MRMNSESTFRKQPVSFVRRGSRLQGRRQSAWDEYSEKYVIDVPRLVADTSVDPHYLFDAEAAFGRSAPLTVEIGSGLGEAIADAASRQPERNFLAVEVYLPGLAQTIQRCASQGLDNVRLVQANAPEVLSTMLAHGSVDELWTFFPDPWPKARHEKRRLVDADFAQLALNALAPSGVWRLATDWEHYALQMLDVLSATPLHNLGSPWSERFEGRIMTSFERKGVEAGRSIYDLSYTKRSS